MGKRLDLLVWESHLAHNDGAGRNYLVQTPSGALYLVFIDSDQDVTFTKSVDNGLTWSDTIEIFAGTTTSLSVWYDRWSGIDAGLIHCAYAESGTDDTLYRTINTESGDALSTQTIIFSGNSATASGGLLTISRAAGGNVYCRATIDAGVEGGFFRLLNANVPNGVWAARALDEALAGWDQMILLPDYDAVDPQDMMAIFWDASTNEISRKLHDDSANTWSETLISTGFADLLATTGFPNFAVAMDIANTRHILVAWNDTDLLNADLQCWTIESGAITAKTNVVTNSASNQGLCAITLDTTTGFWWVFYCGSSDGAETWNTAINVYCKCSTDQGATWGPETKLSNRSGGISWLTAIPRQVAAMYTPPIALYGYDLSNQERIHANVDISQPRAQLQIGI